MGASKGFSATRAHGRTRQTIAKGMHLLPPDAPVAVPSAAAFDQTQSKIAFAQLLDELHIPPPAWCEIGATNMPLPFPFWVKAEYGTARRSTIKVHDER